MIASSLRLQCGAAAARAARREDAPSALPWGVTVVGSTQLIRAALQNNLPRVLQLVQLGAPLDLRSGTGPCSALLWASILGHERVVAALLEGKYDGGGADIEQVSGSYTALEEASWRGHVGVVRVLLARGARQVRPGHTYTPLRWAADYDRVEIARLLLAAPGAGDALKIRCFGRTPL